MSPGASRTTLCRDCGEAIDPLAVFCPHCGARQLPIPTASGNSPWAAAIASTIVPGMGQIYNGDILKGLALGGITVAGVISVEGLVIAVPLWVWLVYDAYRTAKHGGGPPTAP